jgi:hypothetical protein
MSTIYSCGDDSFSILRVLGAGRSRQEARAVGLLVAAHGAVKTNIKRPTQAATAL